MNKYYPRKYRIPKGYYSPELLTNYVFERNRAIALAGLNKDFSSDQTFTSGLAVSEKLAKYKVPTYFVKPDLCEAMIKTQLPDSFRLNQLKFPMPSMLLMLEQEFCRKHFNGNEIIFLGLSLLHSKEEIEVKIADKILIKVCGPEDKENYLLIWSMFSNRVQYHFRCSLDEESTFDKLLNIKLELSPNTNFEDNDEIISKKINTLAVSLLFYTTTVNNEIIQPPTVLMPGITQGKNEHKKIIRETIFNPRWLGEHYKIKRSLSLGGTHASPIMHWRNGHWRHQKIGVGRSEVKLVWIEPTLVNKE